MPAPSQNLPLINRKVLVACSAQKAQALADGLATLGAEVLPLQVIRLREIADNVALHSAVARLETYDWIILTSAHAAQFFSRCLSEQRRDRQPPVCAIGPATATAARDCGFDVALVPDEYVAEGVVRALTERHGGKVAGLRILLPGAKDARDVIPTRLGAAGAVVDSVPCYENTLGEIDDPTMKRIQDGRADLLVFTSSSTVKNFFTLLGDDLARDILAAAVVAALGPITARTVESFGKKCDVLPAENTIASLIEAIRDYYSQTDCP